MRGGALSMTSGALSARHAPHWLAVACGSVSMMRAMAPGFSGGGEVHRQGGFARAALLADDSNNGHGDFLACSHVDV
jgi:hypothetical protein